MKTLLSTPYLTLYLHEGPAPAVELSWSGFVPSQQFREALLQTLEYAAQHRAKGWISDDRQLGALRPRDLEWAFETAIPRLTHLGLLRLAQVESQDAMNRRTINGAYKHNEPTFPFELQRFTDVLVARAWALSTVNLA